MNRKKAFILPSVLIIFTIVFLLFLSNYKRYILSHNFLTVKKIHLKNKLRDYSFKDLASTKNTLEIVNNYNKTPKNVWESIYISKISPKLNGNYYKEFEKLYNSYNFEIRIKQDSKNSIFTTNNSKINLKKNLFVYNTYLNITDGKGSYYEYKFIDKENIFNYLFDYQFIKFKEGIKNSIFSDKFFLNLNEKDYSFLYNRIFDKVAESYINGNFRFYNLGREILFVENDVFIQLLEKYIQSKLEENQNVVIKNVNISKLDEIFTKNKIKNASKDEFIEKYLREYSKVLVDKNRIQKMYNFEITDTLYFDFDKTLEIYSNFKIENAEIKVENQNPILKGLFVNITDKYDYKFEIQGLIISNGIEGKYIFNPNILTRTVKYDKIGNKHYIEFIDIK